MAHNGFKADYPYIEKVLINVDKNILSRTKKDNYTLGSKMARIAEIFDYTPEVLDNEGNPTEKRHDRKIIFIDSLNIQKTNLKTLAKMCGSSVLKGEVDHNKINIDTYKEEIKLQNVEKYALDDSICLLNSILNYRQRVFDKYQIDIFGKKIVYTASSLAM